MKLNLGCGKKVLAGFFNYDKYPINNHVRFIDLDVFPYDLPEANFILLDNVLEHLVNPKRVISELYRCLCYGGIIDINVPHFKWVASYSDPTHIHFFSEGIFKHFKEFRIKKLRVYNNLLPRIPCKRIWHSYYTFPPTNIECTLVKDNKK